MRALALLAALVASPVAAECYYRDTLAIHLYEDMGMSLVSWGLTESGDQVELFMAPSGLWAVIRTQPDRCATLVGTPLQHFERLNEPDDSNRMRRLRKPLERGRTM